MFDTITIKGARLHNLKNVTLSIPKNKVVVLTGVSGSGKSTLAFDILHKEGQRQYMESLGMVTYVSRPPVDAIEGLSPVDQRRSISHQSQPAFHGGHGHRSLHVSARLVRAARSSRLRTVRQRCAAVVRYESR